MLVLLYDFLNLVVGGVKFWTATGPQLRRKDVDSFALQQLDYVEHKMHQCTVLPGDNSVTNNALNSIEHLLN